MGTGGGGTGVGGVVRTAQPGGDRAAAMLDDAEHDRLRSLLAAAAGLAFDTSRRSALALSVTERSLAVGAPSPSAYLGRVERDPAELQQLLDEVTIQETYFFRNPPQIQALRTVVLPELLHRARRTRRLRIWSAGCSTGEEPYTLAMLLREQLPTTAGWDVRVLATDLSQSALARARRATYGPRAVHHASESERQRFFVPTGRGQFTVEDSVRELVEFRHHNLVREPALEGGLDLVLCRNVTIYFDRATTVALVARLHASLRDGGYLFLGHSETLWQINADFDLVSIGHGASAAYVYRRLGPAQAPQVVPTPSRSRRPPVFPQRPGPPVAPITPTQAIRAAIGDCRYADAAALAGAASSREPLRAELHYLQGLALVDLGRDEEALPALRRAVYLAPSSGLAHFLLAGALDRTGDAAAAAREFRAAAVTLAEGDSQAPELGGRTARELALLCAELSSRAG